jgi:hypothetical protein
MFAFLIGKLKQQFFFQDNTTSVCSSCNVPIKTEMGNTTGMANHLKGAHPEMVKILFFDIFLFFCEL